MPRADGGRRRRWGGADPGPRALHDALDDVVGRLGGTDADSFSAVLSRWEEIAGTALAEHSRPLRLSGGVLVVAADQPAWATQVRMLSATLLARISEAGAVSPERLEVVVRPDGGGPRRAS